MAKRRILLVQGHPDNLTPHLCHALADAYSTGATRAGHEVRRVEVAALDFPLLRSQAAWESGELPACLNVAQTDILWCEHIVLFFPLWLGDMPASLKGFLEQVMRPGFAFARSSESGAGSEALAAKHLKGRSGRVVVTMGMPALVYRWYFRAHSVKSLERNILGFIGVAPVEETLIGSVGDIKPATAQVWLGKLERMGNEGR